MKIDDQNGFVWDALSFLDEQKVMIHQGQRFNVPHGVNPNFLCIWITDNGYIRLAYNGRYYDLSRGDIMIMLPSQTITLIESSEDNVSTFIPICNEFFRELRKVNMTRFRHYLANPLIPLDENKKEDLSNAINLLKTLCSKKGKERDSDLLRLLQIFFNLADEFMEYNDYDSQPSRSYDLLLRFLDEVWEHMTESREVKFYADRLNVSTKYLSSCVMQATSEGKKATRWIAQYVCARASALLKTRNDLSIREISEIMGFDEMSSFCRYFKRTTGMSPSDYRDSSAF